MSMIIDYEKKELIFVVPNSEAPMEAQHKGIANRTVGSFYMSERYYDCFEFLNDFKGEFCFDIKLCVENAKKCLEKLKEHHLQNCFKDSLIPQESSIDALEWYSKAESGNFYSISAPTVNEQKKYLKIDNLDEVYKLLKTFLLGDLSRLIFRKIGSDGFIIYIDFVEDFDDKISNGTILKWANK